MDTTVQADFSNIVGVFRDRAQAEQALVALKQAGIDDQAGLTVYDPQDESATDATSQAPSPMRVLVHVRAVGREQAAVEILAQHGANNADVPDGTILVNGSIVREDAATTSTTPAQTAPVDTPAPPLGDTTVPHHPNEVNIIDKR